MQGAARLAQGGARAGLQGRPPCVPREGRHPGDARRGSTHARARRGALSDAPAFTVVIPARVRSTRLAGKMLADVGGKPLVAWVVERARESGARAVVVATDHEDIAGALASLDCRVCLTSPSHETGTDRLGEAVSELELGDREIVVNV